MKKLLLFVLVALMGLGLVVSSFASEARTLTHKFQAYTSNTSVSQSRTIFRITGVATGSNAIFGIYDVGTVGAGAASNLAVEGGEATSGDALPNMTFGEDGLVLNTGASVILSNCNIVIEYI